MTEVERLAQAYWDHRKTADNWVAYQRKFPNDAANVLQGVLALLRAMRRLVYEKDEEAEISFNNILHTAVCDCCSLEPGEGFDSNPGIAAWLAGIDAIIAEHESQS